MAYLQEFIFPCRVYALHLLGFPSSRRYLYTVLECEQGTRNKTRDSGMCDCCALSGRSRNPVIFFDDSPSNGAPNAYFDQSQLRFRDVDGYFVHVCLQPVFLHFLTNEMCYWQAVTMGSILEFLDLFIVLKVSSQ